MNYRLTSLRTLSHGLLLALPLAACSGGGDGTETDADATSEGTGTSGGATEDPTASTTAGGNTDGATDSESGTGSSGSTGDTGDDANFPNCSCADFEGDCIEVTADDEEGLQIAANSLEDNGTLVLGLGSFELDNQVTIRADGITVCGQGIGVEGDFEQGTTLDFAAQMTQSNGLDIVGDKLMEINVFCPGGLAGMEKLEGVNFSAAVIEALERKARYAAYYDRSFDNASMATL